MCFCSSNNQPVNTIVIHEIINYNEIYFNFIIKLLYESLKYK